MVAGFAAGRAVGDVAWLPGRFPRRIAPSSGPGLVPCERAIGHRRAAANDAHSGAEAPCVSTCDREAIQNGVRPLAAGAGDDDTLTLSVDRRHVRPARAAQPDRLAEEVDGLKIGARCDHHLVTVHGRVTDDCTDAATLPGATVRITATDSDSDSVTTITDSAGDYQVTDTFDQTEPYVVTVTMDGFEPAQKETQFPDSDNELDFVLTLEAASLPDYAGC